MSWVYSIKTDNRVDMNLVFQKLRYDRSVNGEERSDTVFYFYGPCLSNRGVDVSIEEYGYEVRITTMSNETDLRLALRLIQIIAELTNGEVFDEEDNKLQGPEYISEEFIKNSFIHDMKLIFQIIKDQGSLFEFPGPTRSVYIGKKIYQENSNYQKRLKTTADILDSIFYDVLYRYTEGSAIEPSLMGADGIDGSTIKLKLVTAGKFLLLQNFDYLIIDNSNETDNKGMILINRNVIDKIHPEGWFYIDECTIMAETNIEWWDNLIKQCKENNCYDEFDKKSKKITK